MPSASIACLTGYNLDHPFRSEFLTGTEHLKRFGPSLRDSIYVLRNRYATAISTFARCENCPCTLLVMHSLVGCLFSSFPQQNRCALNLKLHLDDIDGD
ncbi:hypothetical protein L208DRAFT_1405794 [Tricholoma matsutake]|nr:hypothetical protein L208DRAFT_1405794 [Tricholoma matsutake 945]